MELYTITVIEPDGYKSKYEFNNWEHAKEQYQWEIEPTRKANTVKLYGNKNNKNILLLKQDGVKHEQA